MDTLIRQGKVLYWGTSEWSAAEIAEAHLAARQYNFIPPTMEQPQYNMFVRERFEKEYKRLYETLGLGTTTWSPLASGLLTGKYNDGIPPGSRLGLKDYSWLKERLLGEQGKKNIEKVKSLKKIADALGTSMNRLSIAWCMKNPDVSSVILGASRAEQVEDNLAALETLPLLTEDVMNRIEDVLQNKPTA